MPVPCFSLFKSLLRPLARASPWEEGVRLGMESEPRLPHSSLYFSEKMILLRNGAKVILPMGDIRALKVLL